MVKITAQFISECPQYTNPCREREIDFRGCKISIIENLGPTLDQFESMDMSDNDIKKLEGFSLLRRLKTLILNNNHISRIDETLNLVIPNLEALYLTNNSIKDLNDILPLASLKKLKYLSFLRNPCCSKLNYRLFVINMFPELRVLDYQKVHPKERENSVKLFRSINEKFSSKNLTKTFELKEVVAKLKELEQQQQITSQINSNHEQMNPVVTAQMEQNIKNIEAIKNAISNAASLDDVQKLETLLKKGVVPSSNMAENFVDDNNE